MKLFLYGTLKRSFCRNVAVESETYLGDAATAPQYRMYNIGTYPGLVDAPDDGLSIQGEIWDVSDAALANLDNIEDVHYGEYERRGIQLMDSRFDYVEAYFYTRPITGLPDCGSVWL